MKEQIYILKNPESFNLMHIFECGQCFRWNKQDDGSYTGVIKHGVINVKQIENDLVFKGMCRENIEEIINDYFDLKTSYTNLKKKLSNIDEYMKESINFGEGIRILNQDLWECIISFIISANNNIPRIKKIIEKISQNYGKKILWNNKEYYTFPTPQELSQASIGDLRSLGLGFRDKRVYTTTKMIVGNTVNLNLLRNSNDSNYIRETLLKLDGVGEKVADCIMLFSLKRFDVFPVDVWVRRVMNDLYIHNENEEKVNKKEIKKIAEEKFLGIPGLAQQYLFYWKREEGKGA